MRYIGLLVVLASAGCSPIAYGPPVTTMNVKSTYLERQRHNTGPEAKVTQDGTEVSLSVHQGCVVEEREMQVTERTVTYPRVLVHPGYDWAFLVLGAVSGGLGAFAIADAQNLASSNNAGPTGNSSNSSGASPTAYQATGGVLIGLGAAFMTVALVDAIRASGSRETVDNVVVPGRVVRKLLDCPFVPLKGVEVRATPTALPNESVALGSTDADGLLKIDVATGTISLRQLVPILRAKTTPLMVGNTRVGTFNSGPAVAVLEERAWTRIPRESCQEIGQPSCAQLEAFRSAFPESSHNGEVDALLKQARDRLDARLLAERRSEEARDAAERRAIEARENEAKRKVQAAQQAGAARAACAQKCSAVCAGNQACVTQCVSSKCQ